MTISSRIIEKTIQISLYFSIHCLNFPAKYDNYVFFGTDTSTQLKLQIPNFDWSKLDFL